MLWCGQSRNYRHRMRSLRRSSHLPMSEIWRSDDSCRATSGMTLKQVLMVLHGLRSSACSWSAPDYGDLDRTPSYSLPTVSRTVVSSVFRVWQV